MRKSCCNQPLYPKLYMSDRQYNNKKPICWRSCLSTDQPLGSTAVRLSSDKHIYTEVKLRMQTSSGCFIWEKVKRMDNKKKEGKACMTVNVGTAVKILSEKY